MMIHRQPRFQFGEEVFYSAKMHCCENGKIEQYLTLKFTVIGIVLNNNEYEYMLSHEGYTINYVAETALVHGEEQ